MKRRLSTRKEHTARRVIAAVMMAAAFSGATVMAVPPTAAGTGYDLVFADEFNGTSLDTMKGWIDSYPWGRTHNDDAYMASDHVIFGDGTLTLRGERLAQGGKTFTSGAISTGYSNYKAKGGGYIEARILLTTTPGSWPAFWGLDTGWPPEADIMEYPLTTDGGTSGLPNTEYNTAFHYTDGSGNAASGAGPVDPSGVGALNTGYHTFGMQWVDGASVTFYFDGVAVSSFTSSAVAQMSSMYLIFDQAIGGWPGTPSTTQWPSGHTDDMKVDWVRVWQQRASGASTTSTWKTNGSGSWDTSGNWTGIVPIYSGQHAVFGTVGTAATATVDWSTSRTLGGITFSGATTTTTAYTLGSGNESLQLAGSSGTANAYVEALATSQADQTVASRLELYNTTEFRNNMTGGQRLLLNGALVGDGGVIVNGAGTVLFSNNNTYTGTTTIGVNQGAAVARVTRSRPFGTSGVVAFDPAGNATTARIEIQDTREVPNAITFGGRTNPSVGIENISANNIFSGTISAQVGGSYYIIQSDSGLLTLSGTAAGANGVALSAGATGSRTFTLQGDGSGLVSGIIQNGSATVSLAKAGNGTWTLGAANTYTGTTSLTAGTLAVTGSIASGGALNAAAGTTLTGTGTINTNATINGTHQPGTGVGTQTFGTLAYGGTARLAWELGSNSVATGSGDRVAAVAVTIANGAALDVYLNTSGSTVTLNDAFWTQPHSWTVLSATSISGSFALGNVSTDSAGRAVSTYGTFALQQTATAVTLTFTPTIAAGDSDADGLPDAWEIKYFGNLAQTAAGDYDGDGFTNLQEFQNGTDPAIAAQFAPYSADANTLVLFHFDEAAGGSSALNLGTLGKNAYSVDMTTASAAPTVVTTVLGAIGRTGLGNAATFATGRLFGWDYNNSGAYQGDVSNTSLSADSLAMSTLNMGNGSQTPWTIEAMVYCSLSTLNANQEIICTDSSTTSRGFQFRINSGQLELNLIANNTDIKTTIPTTGTHAYTANTWYHVAASYDGTNIKLYWTRVFPGATSANLISTTAASVGTTFGAVTGPLCIGGENRGANGEYFQGRIDEVRISKVARAAAEMLPAFVDNDADGLPDWWEILHFGDLSQTAAGDPDGDGLTNLQEYQRGSDPNVSDNPDSDHDGLPDAWEMTYFGSLIYGANDDPDGDGYTNAQEYAAGSNPNIKASTPADIDGDGLPDAWEIQYFGSITAQGASGDPDGDGFTNLQEYLGGSNPTNLNSVPGDTDGDTLPDSWETANLGGLSYGAYDDPDGDGYTNLAEMLAGTNPLVASSHPSWKSPRVAFLRDSVVTNNACLMPSSATYGRAINGISFQKNILLTFNGYQYTAWYDTVGTTQLVWLARRTVSNTGVGTWETFNTGSEFLNGDEGVWDAHNVIALGICPQDGTLHMAWDHHGNTLRYRRSIAGLCTTNTAAWGAGMLNAEQNWLESSSVTVTDVTYPQFIPTPTGGLMMDRRYGASGDGDQVLQSYIPINGATGGNWNSQILFLSRTGTYQGSTSRNAYLNGFDFGPDGKIHVTWTWREGAGSSNHDICYAYSADNGVTWRNNAGTVVADTSAGQSINLDTPGIIVKPLDMNQLLINQQSQCVDYDGRLHVLMLHRRQDPGYAYPNYTTATFTTLATAYYHYFRDPATGAWSQRRIPLDAYPVGSRPKIVYDTAGNLYAAYLSYPAGTDAVPGYTNGKLVIASTSKASQYTDWEVVQVNDTALDGEPLIDQDRLLTDNILSVYIQEHSATTTVVGTPLHIYDFAVNVPKPSPTSLAFFGNDVVIGIQGQSGLNYQLQTSTTLGSWSNVGAAVTGRNALLALPHPGGAQQRSAFYRVFSSP